MSGRLLAIDAATPACSVALFEGKKLIANEYQEIGRGHAEKLIPMIASLPKKGQAAQILVNCGPGSFTGVRIGLSAARALALAWGAKLTGYQCLQLVAVQAQAGLAQKAAIYVTMNAGHGEFFVQNFSEDGDALDSLRSLSPDAALDNANASVFVGSAATNLAEQCKDASSISLLPDAAYCPMLSAKASKLPIKPIYGRPPDAQPATIPVS